MLSLSISFAAEQKLASMDAVAERMGAGSRELAKGNATVADTSAFFAAYWNPGMLAFKRNLSVALHAENRSLDRAGGSLGIEGGAGSRMGVGAAILFREDNNYRGTAMLGYAGLGYRLNRANGIGISLSAIYEDEYQSPLSFDLGWFRFWNEKWQSGLQVRNLSFNSKLSASWQGENYYMFRPKTFEAGVTHRNLILRKPASVSLSLLSYQVADTLFVFDPDWHIFKGRFGFEWEAIPAGSIRLGIDGRDPSIGIGYGLKIGSKTLFIDYAFIYEWDADLLNPLSLTLRMKF